MKKKLGWLAVVLLTLCLVSFALERIAPASPVQADRTVQPDLGETSAMVEESVPLTGSAAAGPEPAVSIATGLVCVLFAILAFSPLLIDDPALKLPEANPAQE